MEFCEWQEDGGWFAVVTLDLFLCEAGSSRVLVHATPTAKVRAMKTGDFTPMAKAMSEAVAAVCRGFIEEDAAQLKH